MSRDPSVSADEGSLLEPLPPGVADHPGLAAVLGDLGGRLEELRRGFVRDCEEDLAAPLREALANAAERHRALVGRIGLDAPGSEPPWSAARGYRDSVREEVLEPLAERLGTLDLGQALEERWNALRRELTTLEADLPESLERPEPEDLYEPLPTDGLRVGVGKRIVRWRRRGGAVLRSFEGALARLVGREPPSAPARVQAVPVQALATRHLASALPLELDPTLEELQRFFARSVQAAEVAAGRWFRNWPGVEDRLHCSPELVLSGTPETWTLRRPEAPEAVGGSSSPDPPADEAEGGEGGRSAGSVAGTLQEVLDEAAEGAAESLPLTALDLALGAAWRNLLGDLRISDTFMERRESRRLVRRAQASDERRRDRSRDWAAWHHRVCGRFTLIIRLLRLREAWDAAEDRLLRGVSDRVLLPLTTSWRRAQVELGDLRRRTEKRFERALEDPDAAELDREVQSVLEDALDLLGSALGSPLEEGRPADLIEALANDATDELVRGMRDLPEEVDVHPLALDDADPDPQAGPRTVPCQALAREVLDVLRLEGFRTSPDPLLALLADARTEASEIPNVVRYNLEAAREDLGEPGAEELRARLEDARSLTLNGLSRTADALGELLGEISPAWEAFATGAHAVLEGAFRQIHARAVAEGAVQEQILDLRTSVEARGRAGLERLRKVNDRLARWLRRATVRVIRRGRGLIRLGRSAVGTAPSGEAEVERAMESLARGPDLLEGLPLVYRRLFSFQPVTDPAFLQGRGEDEQWVRRRFSIWRTDPSSPIVLVGSVGVGHTSFLNVLEATLFSDAKIHRLELETRMRRGADLATRVADALELAAEEPWTLERLERALLDLPEAGPAEVVLLERLEHAFKRTVGGTDLVQAFLSLQARTAERVFWISTMSDAAWKIVEKTEPRAAGLAVARTLAPLSREALEAAILTRHQRSGVPLEFMEPPDLNPLERRRLRTRDPEARQDALRKDYFDRLQRMSQGSVMMAIYHWLRSADFESREGWLRVHPPEPVSLAFLEDLDLSLDFALKAFLEHGSLTIDELAEVFGIPTAESAEILMALRVRMLLQPMGARGGLGLAAGGIEDGERYRIPALLTEAVVRRLRNRNIFH